MRILGHMLPWCCGWMWLGSKLIVSNTQLVHQADKLTGTVGTRLDIFEETGLKRGSQHYTSAFVPKQTIYLFECGPY